MSAAILRPPALFVGRSDQRRCLATKDSDQCIYARPHALMHLGSKVGYWEPYETDDGCITCGEVDGAEGECPHSKRPCGHHCNCSWVHDHCHWCGVEFGEDGVETEP